MTKKRKSRVKKKTAASSGTLTPLQAAFVQHYIIEKNASEAARKAGYSEKVAGQQGHENLKKPEIRAAIDEKFRQLNERLDFRADRVLLELARMVDVDIALAYDEQGNLKPIKDIPIDVRRCIESIETVQELGPPGPDGQPTMVEVRKVKFVSRKSAVELAMKHFGQLKERVEHSGKIGLEALIAGSNDAGSKED